MHHHFASFSFLLPYHGHLLACLLDVLMTVQEDVLVDWSAGTKESEKWWIWSVRKKTKKVNALKEIVGYLLNASEALAVCGGTSSFPS